MIPPITLAPGTHVWDLYYVASIRERVLKATIQAAYLKALCFGGGFIPLSYTVTNEEDLL